VKGGHGGYFADALDVNNGTVNVYGGTLSGGSGVITGSAITVNGGTVNLFGGSFQAGSTQLPHSTYGIDLYQGTVNIYGSGFNYDLGPLNALEGTLTGTLSDGTPLDLPFSQALLGHIILIPEPSACGLFALGLLSLFANLAPRSKCRRA
jgi:hypothetical protein